MRSSVLIKPCLFSIARNSAGTAYLCSLSGADPLCRFPFPAFTIEHHFNYSMASSGGRAESVFLDDVENTYAHIRRRVETIQEQELAGKEQIQLVPEEGSNQTISFNVPDGAPPEEIKLEGPGTENLDPVEVRKALLMRWEIFDGFDPKMKEALQSGKLEEVNKVLGAMEVSEAEAVVNQLNLAGILSFADGGIRDETGKGK